MLGTGFFPEFPLHPAFLSNLSPAALCCTLVLFKDVESWKRPECGVWGRLFLMSERIQLISRIFYCGSHLLFPKEIWFLRLSTKRGSGVLLAGRHQRMVALGWSFG